MVQERENIGSDSINRLSFHPFLFFFFGSLDEPNTYQPIKHFHKSRPDNYGRMLSGELINIKRCTLKGMSPLFNMLKSGLRLFHGRTSTHLSCSLLTSIWRVLHVDTIILLHNCTFCCVGTLGS